MQLMKGTYILVKNQVEKSLSPKSSMKIRLSIVKKISQSKLYKTLKLLFKAIKKLEAG